MKLESDALQGKGLVFVIGVFRSGASLLHRMLRAHPAVSLMWEADDRCAFSGGQGAGGLVAAARRVERLHLASPVYLARF